MSQCVTPLITGSELYLLQGQVIEDLYDNNLEDDPEIHADEHLRYVADLERKFIAWKRRLPPRLQRTPWVDGCPPNPDNAHRTSNFDRLSVILALRYLNARLLLRRTLLVLCLRGGTHLMPDRALTHEERPYFDRKVINEITICESDAMEVIEIISSTNPYPFLRTSWWFSAYYCERTTSHILTLAAADPLLGFTAALTVFSCFVVRVRCKRLWQDTSIRDTTIDHHRGLHLAAETLHAYGKNTGAQRAQKTICKLIKLQSEISMLLSPL
jgi:hypothetical protein